MKSHQHTATSPKMEQYPNSLKLCSDNHNSTTRPPKAKRISISIFVISLPFLYLSLLHVPPSNLLKDTTFWFLMSNSIIIIVATDSGVFASSNEAGAADIYDEYVKHTRARSASVVSHRPEIVNAKEIPEQLKYIDQVVVNEKESTKDYALGHIDDEKESSKELSHDQNLRLQELGHDQVLDRQVVVANEVEMMSSKEKKFDRSRSEVAVKNIRDDVARKKVVRRSATQKRNCRSVEESEYWKMSDEELNKRVEEFITRFNREIRLQG